MDKPVIPTPLIREDPWIGLKSLTAARIALGRTGVAVPLREVLAFRLAHAHARDAVHTAWDTDVMIKELEPLSGYPVWVVNSQASDRFQYLQRPDKGRLLHSSSAALLENANLPAGDIVLVIADGLSATAVQHHAAPLLRLLVPALKAEGFSMLPLVLVRQGRVAIGDQVAALLKARLSLLLVGERPGLTAADSLGAYLTYAPKPGLTDDNRNCVSNIRPRGLSYEDAASRLLHLVKEAFRKQISGVALKDTQQLPESGS
ncbi:ethanolamine ammonia-lyase subunit EutC [Filimonas effusa]|uniref:Ethanolamine ammonia-lyase small subunit n=1 Tax=Filimonas effusa TaxID=2508721 RepID=A0A4Q1D9T0_9BACT|nr:ethanolamine ammonia-lyase subunit EutC [Filimonas effusa]RXK86134.1 ethanolamine ammonia-lyase subunit EutC [Filimonas effusa]